MFFSRRIHSWQEIPPQKRGFVRAGGQHQHRQLLTRHLTSNRSLNSPVDGNGDSQEKSRARSAKRAAVTSELGWRMLYFPDRNVFVSTIKGSFLLTSFLLLIEPGSQPPQTLGTPSSLEPAGTQLWGEALEVPLQRMRKFSERKSSVYFHITALGCIHLARGWNRVRGT